MGTASSFGSALIRNSAREIPRPAGESAGLRNDALKRRAKLTHYPFPGDWRKRWASGRLLGGEIDVYLHIVWFASS
jgi:hypothetical protein